MSDFTEYIAEVVRAQKEHDSKEFRNSVHKWPEVTDFCMEAVDDPQWEVATSIASMRAIIAINGWSATDSYIGEAAMNTWYAFKNLKRTSER